MNWREFALKLAKWLIRQAMQPELKQRLPKIYDRIDTEMPFWLRQRISAPQMTVVLNQAVAHVLGRNPTPAESSMIRLLYDPVQAAANTILIRTKGRLDW